MLSLDFAGRRLAGCVAVAIRFHRPVELPERRVVREVRPAFRCIR